MQSVLEDLIALMRTFNGKSYSGLMSADTYFFADLGMASIDAVVLAERIEQYYGQKFPFRKFLQQQMQSKVRDLSLGELAQFLAEHLKKSEE